MTRLVKTFRFPRINITAILTAYCLFGLIYIMSSSQQKEMIELKREAAEEWPRVSKALPRHSFAQESNFETQPNISAAKVKFFYI